MRKKILAVCDEEASYACSFTAWLESKGHYPFEFIVLTGGGALLGGLETLIEEETGINTVVAEEPAMAVAIGTGQYMELMSKINGK